MNDYGPGRNASIELSLPVRTGTGGRRTLVGSVIYHQFARRVLCSIVFSA